MVSNLVVSFGLLLSAISAYILGSFSKELLHLFRPLVSFLLLLLRSDKYFGIRRL
jgi:hypothetical protein